MNTNNIKSLSDFCYWIGSIVFVCFCFVLAIVLLKSLMTFGAKNFWGYSFPFFLAMFGLLHWLGYMKLRPAAILAIVLHFLCAMIYSVNCLSRVWEVLETSQLHYLKNIQWDIFYAICHFFLCYKLAVSNDIFRKYKKEPTLKSPARG